MRFRNERVLGRELLEAAPEDAVRANLSDLVRINRYFGGHLILRRCLDECSATLATSALDVGAGSGDMARAAARTTRVVSLDLAAHHLRDAPPPKLAADAARLPFRDGAFDIVFSSLFLHHFSDEHAALLLREMARVARRYVIAIDLERSAVSYHFVPATRAVFGWHPVTVHDGPASVQAGFRAAEFEALARRAGLASIRVRRHFPWFRLSLIAAVPQKS